jgi:hypothetical protein
MLRRFVPKPVMGAAHPCRDERGRPDNSLERERGLMVGNQYLRPLVSQCIHAETRALRSER